MKFFWIIFLFILAATSIAWSLNLSFAVDALDMIWISACIITAFFAAAHHLGYKMSILIFIFAAVTYTVFSVTYLSGERRERILSFDDGCAVKVYTVALGFTDAETTYKIYRKVKFFPILEAYLGAARSGKIYIRPDAEPKMVSDKVIIVEYGDLKTDTFPIRK